MNNKPGVIIKNDWHVSSINDSDLELFVRNSKFSHFMQTSLWGNFQQKFDKKIYKLGFFKKNVLLGTAVVLIEKSKVGSLAYVPRGPVTDWTDRSISDPIIYLLISHLRKIEPNLFMLRIDPALEKSDFGDVDADLKAFGFFDAIMPIQVENAWVVDISQPLDDILTNMRKNTRYSIRRAEKNKVRVEVSTDIEDFELFYQLLHRLASTKHFAPFSKRYLEEEFRYFTKRKPLFEIPFMRLFKAVDSSGKMLASAMIMFYKDEAFYLHAASSLEGNKLLASYLIQWHVIKYAKDLGCKKYNLWGVLLEKDMIPENPGYGYSLFKRGFGGGLHSYIRTKEYPFNWIKYSLLRLQERRWRRKNGLL